MKNDIDIKQLREFGLIISLGVPLAFGLVFPKIAGHDFQQWTLYVGFIALLLGIIKPSLLFYPYKAWILIGEILGWINSRIILGLIFIIILQPLAICMKISGYDPLRKYKNKGNSYKEIKNNNRVNLKKIF